MSAPMSLSRTGRTSPCWRSASPGRCRWCPPSGCRCCKQPGRLLLTIGLAGTPFLLWDLWATHVGHWWFDADQTLPWRLAGLPLEEIGFFVVIPVVSVLTLEGVRAARRGVRPGAPRSREDAR